MVSWPRHKLSNIPAINGSGGASLIGLRDVSTVDWALEIELFITLYLSYSNSVGLADAAFYWPGGGRMGKHMHAFRQQQQRLPMNRDGDLQCQEWKFREASHHRAPV